MIKQVTINTKFSGKLLKLVGTLAGKDYLYFFGHYLEGSGKRIKMTSRIVEALEENILLKEKNTYANNNYATAFGNSGSHFAVGKSKYRMKGKIVYFLDYYKFYQTCNGASVHGSWCKCENKSWEASEQKISFPLFDLFNNTYWAVRRYGNKLQFFKIDREEYFEIYHKIEQGFPACVFGFSKFEVTIKISDFFASKLGKPFYSSGHKVFRRRSIIRKIELWYKNYQKEIREHERENYIYAFHKKKNGDIYLHKHYYVIAKEKQDG